MLAMENQNGMLINRSSDTFGRPIGFTLFPLHLGEGQGEGKPQYSVAYAYDEFGRFASVSSSASLANLAVQYSYLPDTDIIAGYTSGDFTRSISYEPARSLITSVENKFGNSTISRYDYTNDELGRRTAIARSGNAFGDIPVTDSYGYNLRSEVTSARRTLSADPAQAIPGFSHDYTYDPIGNRIAATNNQEAIAYTANSLNQYTAVNETKPVYDDDGNLLSDGRFNYTWNGENRLVMASNETYVVSYVYDHQGRVVWKQIAGPDSATKTITYTWDDFNIVAETICTLQSTIRNYNVWGLDLSQSLQGAGGVGGLLAVISPLPLGEGQGEGSMALACYDANGNITEYLSESGTTAAHYEYSPFGEIAVQTGSLASTFTHRFSTKPWCAVTGFSEYEYRKYSPALGRWLSRDPIGDIRFKLIAYIQRYRRSGRWLRMSDGTPNLFRFVNNEPIFWLDFDGVVSRKTDDVSATGDPGKKKSPWDEVPSGSIRCNEKCEMEITGCDKWPEILQSCCQKHETVHLGQIGDSFCKWQTVTKTLPSGEKKEENCCPDAGKVPKFGTPDMKNMKQWPDGECPAYKISVECMDALLSKNLSHEDRKLVLSKLRQECGIMNKNNCPDTPSTCINFSGDL